MIIYIMILLFAALTLINKRYSRGYSILLWLILILVAGFRYNVGTDYFRYNESYENSTFWYNDKGFILLTSMMKYIHISAQMYFLIISLLIQILVFYSLLKLTGTKKTYYLSIFFYITLYYYNNSLNTIRQFLAIGLCLYSIQFILNKKFVKYTLTTLIAFFMHSSSIIFFPAICLAKLINKISNLKTLRNVLLCVSFLLMFVRFDSLIQKLIIQFGSNINYLYYAKWGANSYLTYDLSIKMLVLLFVKFVLSIWIINQKSSFIKNKTQEIIYSIFFIGLILTFPLYPMLIFRRLLFYFNITEVIIYALFATKNKRGYIVLLIFAVCYYFTNLISGYSLPLPYNIRI